MTRRVRAWLVSGLLLSLGVGLGWWAAATVLRPPANVLAAPAYTMVEAREGSVGRSLSLRAAAEWVPVGEYSTAVDGVVTEVHMVEGELADAGDLLLSIDLRPVTLAQGSVPMFRVLSEEMSGQDVAQLQSFLAERGYDVGQDEDGRFGPGTLDAVRQWQAEAGYAVSGAVAAGDLLFLPDLPVRLILDDAVGVGARVGPGQPLLRSLSAEPAFEIVLPQGQLALVQPGQDVTVDAGEQTWHARVADVGVEGEDGEFTAALEAVEESDVICGDACAQVRTSGRELFPSVVVIEPTQSGVVVPTSAVVTSADGQQAVIGDDGSAVGVRMLGSGQGLALVEGVPAGTLVRAPGLLPPRSSPSS